MPVQDVALKGLPVLDWISPYLASIVAEAVYRTPPRPPLSSRAAEFLGGARRHSVRVGRERLAIYRWGHGPQVYLMHGWAGRTTQFHTFVPALVDAGYQVIGIDAVAHGLSTGHRSSVLQFRDSLLAVIKRTARGPVRAVIAHSMGGSATALALAGGLSIEKFVMIGSPTEPRQFLEPFKQRLGLSDEAMTALADRLMRQTGVSWDDLTVPNLSASLKTPLLIFHDKNDEAVPYRNGVEIAAAWPGARLVSTEGLGHQRILRDPAVIKEALAFLAEAAPACSTCGRPVREASRCEACSVDQELFHRYRR